MKKSYYLQIFVFAIIVALMGSFNNYGQNMKSKDIKFIDRNRTSNGLQSDVQNRNSDDIQLNKLQRNSKVVTQFAPNGVQTVLYDQTGGTTNEGVPAQDFETAYDAYDCENADNFTVPAGGWTVRNVIVAGFYDGGPAESFNVYFYPDAAGVPGATPVYSAISQPYFYNPATSYFTIVLGTDAVLSPGNYWISVQARMDVVTSGQWFWLESTGPIGTEAHFQNPGNGFVTGCTTWGPITGCLGATDTELSFALTDVECPVVPLPVIADFEDGVIPPLCWTIVNSPTEPIWFYDTGVSGYGVGEYALVADFYDWDGASGDLITLEYDASTASYPTLSFDWAYADFSGSEADELDIYYSTNGGTNWTILAAMYNGAPGENNLNPFGLSSVPAYYPADDEWSTRSIPLPENTNMIKFTGIANYGNLCWVDNIKIGDTFFDTFEAYTFPGQVACQGTPDWTTWSLAPCSSDDATISTTYAYSGTKSALIDYVATRDVDLVKLHDKNTAPQPTPYSFVELTTGKWYISFRFYIPAGKSGYFNVQSLFTGEQTFGVWGMECYFDAGGGGRLSNGSVIPFNWTEDNWNNCLVIVDLNTATAEFWVGRNAMTQISVWDWTRGGTQVNSLDGTDMYGAVLNQDQMYIDDYRFSNIAPPIPQPADEVGTVSIDMDYQYAPGTVVPKATVKNYGTNTNSFDVEMTITGGYSSTVAVTDLAPGATQQVTFADWNPTTIGPYTVNVCTQLTGDEEPLNDCQVQSVNIWDESGEWTSGADYPITSYNGIGVSYNDGTTDWLYVMGGNTTSALRTECYKYNVNANTWTQIASLPAARLISAGAVVGNYIYVIGGSDGSTNTVTYHNTTYRYDIVGNTWSEVAILPLLYGWGRAVAYNDGTDDYIYLAGGIEQDLTGATFYIADVYLYDVAANTWILTPSPMPDGIFGGGFSIVGNKLVYATGATPAGISNIVYVGTINPADPTDITWETMSSYPGNIKQVYGINGTDVMATMPNLSIGTSKNGHPPLAAIFPAGGIYRNHAHPWGDDAIIIGGGTPTSVYEAADPGPCYVYKPGTDTWTAQENMLVPVGAHQSGTFHDGNTWKYIITSGFGVSAVTSATQIYTQTLGGATTFQITVNIQDKWNIVSIPGLHPTNQNVNTWWQYRDITANVFYYADPAPPAPNGYVAVTEVTPSTGYWMKHSGARTYNTGPTPPGDEWPAGGIQIVAHSPISVFTNWNLFGGYENVVATANVYAANPGLIVANSIYQYSSTTPPTGYTNPANIEPGRGYWIKINSPGGTLTIPESMAKVNGEPVEYYKSDWGRIILTDATGSSYTLYAVKGQVDLNLYELPPAPPAGMFDIRFGSGRIAENLNSSIQTIDMSGITYPLTVRVEGMDIRLQDATGKQINANLKSGEDVVISDATIQKLMVSGESIPTVYALEQNYPNPFNPSTVIEFSLPEDVGNVKLSIYNALGEKVAELVNTALTAGKYQYQWNAQNVATGMYIYELRTDKFVSIKKMVLLK